jgi:hypothetical protein
MFARGNRYFIQQVSDLTYGIIHAGHIVSHAFGLRGTCLKKAH